jgi:TnpA family transposase
MFDESLNTISNRKQMDVYIRFSDGGQVNSRYLTSQFMSIPLLMM